MGTSQRGYSTVSAILFAVVAGFQCVRAFNGWSVEINHFAVPVAASWGVAAVTGLLAIWGWRSR